jgi:hypothetical protein
MRIKQIGWSIFTLLLCLPALARADDDTPWACPTNELYRVL